MPITENDIKLLASQRMTDTPDGGGRMTGTVVQSGVDNNIFDDVPNLARVYGNVSLRKVFVAVLTDTTDKYMGARVIIDKPPSDDSVHALLFDASSTFDTRDDVSVKVESYLSRGVAAMCYLYGDHITGQASMQLASAESRDTPSIGTVFVLRNQNDEQYVRVTTAESVVVEFPSTTGTPYRLRLSSLGLSDPLRHDFAGWGPIQGGMVTKDMVHSTVSTQNHTLVYDSLVADAAQYYGIRPLAEAATTGAYGVKADSAYSTLLPSAQIETPIADARTNNLSATLVSAGSPVVLSSLAPTPSQTTFIGGAILPGSLTAVSGGVTATDVGGALRVGGTEVGSVDYENGVLAVSTNVFGGRGSATITYTPASVPVSVPVSIGATVTINNRSLSYVVSLGTVPARKSLSVSYMANGRWYVLREDGSGAVRGAQNGLGAGVLNYTTGTVNITLGALPDVGSAIVYQFVPADAAAKPAPAMLLGGKVFAPLNTSGQVSTERGEKTISPNSLTLTWSHGGTTKTATDNGNGVLQGDATGTVDYQAGVVMWSPTVLPAKGTVIIMQKDSVVTEAYSAAVVVTASSITMTLPGGVVPGGFRAQCLLNVYGPSEFVPYSGHDNRWWVYLGGVELSDAAGVVYLRHPMVASGTQVEVGTINYLTGVVIIDSVNLVGVPVIMRATGYTYWQLDANNKGWNTSSLEGPQSVESGGVVMYGTTADTILTRQPATPDPISVTLSAAMLMAEYVPPNQTMAGVSFKLGNQRFTSTPDGTLYRDTNPNTGVGTAVGVVQGSLGAIALASWDAGITTVSTDFRAALSTPTSGEGVEARGSSVLFRTAVAPLRPSSLQVTGNLSDGTAFDVTADANGRINHARVKGFVNVAFGVVELVFCNASATGIGTADVSRFGLPGVSTINLDTAKPETLRYNAVAYTYLPLDANILGLDPVRLPSDGRVPVFKSGRVVVVHNTQQMAPVTVSNGQTLNTSRTRLARVRVIGANGNDITAGWTADLDAGTVTFTNVTGYSQPVVIEHRIEDEALCAEAQITGDLRLTRPLTHDFPANTSYVSSALIAGTKQSASTESFSQNTWTNVWSDARIGAPITAQYNQTLHPIVVTNRGAIEQRWVLLFNNNTTFRVIGESVGEILTGNTGELCAPLNPATGAPYFSLAAGGWGAGWVAGNVLRFNTASATHPVWVSRTVMQSPAAPPGTDQIVISIRGDIDV